LPLAAAGFGTTEVKSNVKDTPAEVQLARKMRDAWAAFAKDPTNGLTKLGWPLYDPKKNTLIVLGGDNDGSIRFVNPAQNDATCALLALAKKAGAASPKAVPKPAATKGKMSKTPKVPNF